MSVFNSLPPKISKIELIKWLKVNYSIFYNKNISIKELKSERDKNFLLKLKNKQSYVIKISNPAESINLLKLQDFVLNNLIKNLMLMILKKQENMLYITELGIH